MKGLECARAYYEAFGAQLLDGVPANVRDRIAFGLVGPGSECFGFDDELSHDHDFGPGFCLWLPSEVFDVWGHELQRRYEALPQTYAGMTRKKTALAGKRVGVFETTAFYRTFTGLDHTPQVPREWLAIPEQLLATATNGEVFCDSSGEFSELRKRLLSFYPLDVVKLKVAAGCASMAQAGQYNLPRMLKREDAVAAGAARSEFLTSFMAVLHLLSRTYMPFYKWSYRSLIERVGAPRSVCALVRRIASAPVAEIQTEDIETACLLISQTVAALGWVGYVHGFLLDAAVEIKDGIEDRLLAAMPLGTGAAV